MEKFTVSIKSGAKELQFDVADYLHHNGEHCKFEVFLDNEFVASFEPDPHQFLHVCKNTGKLDDNILNLLCDKLEKLPHSDMKNEFNSN